ncbi:MAG: hypothetical protein JNL11_03105 [Bdellovibrionaceae bacterium]|nr:hypothetical protein [Pseudobdellovibrionaceae bacterium]
MLKQKSFLIVIIAFFWAGYVLLSFAQTVYGSVEFKKTADQNRNSHIDHLLSVSQTLVLLGNVDALKAHLDEAVRLKTIQFYCIKNKDQVMFEISVNQYSGCAMTSDRRIASYGDTLNYEKQVVKPIKVDDHVVSVGYATDTAAYVWEDQKSNITAFIKDIIIITTFLGFLVYLIMKDFLQLDRLLQAGGKGDISKIKARSREAQTLIDSTLTLDQMNSEKSDKIHHLQNTVGLAIHSEIDNKTPHLAQIPCAVIRIDLNGYTQIFLEKKEEHIVTVLNEYFSVTNDLIKRFDGQIYQIIGDEIVFVIKNQNTLRALFCVRAIFEWADELDRKIQNQYKHRFLLKASISYGHLRFVQLNNGYAFAGLPLIESVRLLGCVSDKSENTLIIKTDAVESGPGFLRNHASKEVNLKGFDDKSEIFEIKEFISFPEFFKSANNVNDELNQKKAISYLDYFRSQNDIVSALDILNDSLNRKKWSDSFHLIQHLKNVKLDVKSEVIANNLFRILSDHFQLINNNVKEHSFLNSLVLATQSLVHINLWNPHWEQLFKNYLLSLQPRIVANSTEVLCHFGYDSDEMQRILSNWKGNNRISANFLLSSMKKSIDKNSVKTVLNWFESDNVLFQASALYVLEETLRFYRIEDPVVYRTNALLAECLTSAEKFKGSDNPLIQSRYEKLKVVAMSGAALELKILAAG